MNDRVRAILGRVGRLTVPLASLDDEADLHEAGLTSFGTVELMLAVEEEFGIEFPEELIARARFSSIAAIGEVVRILAAPDAEPEAARSPRTELHR